MGPGVEVAGIHDVGILGQGRGGDCGSQLRPIRRPHQDDGIGIDGADGGDDDIRVVFNDVPGHAIGFITDFI